MSKTWTTLNAGRWIAVAVTVLSALLVPACKSSKAPPPEAWLPITENVIQEGDVLLLAFPAATNLNTIVRIPIDGTFELPFTQPIQAAGKTPQQLQQEILTAYGEQLQMKEVNVTVMSSSAAVYLSGAVLRPGKVPLVRPLTALEAIMEAGGFDNSRAKPGKVLVIRLQGDQQVTMEIDLKKAMRGTDIDTFYLRPSDIVHVPFKTFNL